MSREIIQPAGTTPGGILSPGVRVGNLLWTAGSTGSNPETGETSDDVQEQTRQTLEKLKKVVEAAGSSFANAVKVNIYLSDISDRPAVNDVYKTYFPTNPPGRTCIGNAGFDGNTKIEIEMVVAIPD
jgi:2-iminobutanoate/2-iminopropanoate deaminase